MFFNFIFLLFSQAGLGFSFCDYKIPQQGKDCFSKSKSDIFSQNLLRIFTLHL